MIKTLEDEIMLEIANNIEVGDELDYVMGDDGEEISPEDFDDGSHEGQVFGLIDLLLESPTRANVFDKKDNLYSSNGVSATDIKSAEDKLGVRFSSDFKDYLKTYGVVSFSSHEFMGLGGDNHLNVVKETLRERKNNSNFPDNCYVIENLGIDGRLILQDNTGKIYELSSSGVRKICNSLKEYIGKL